MVERRSRKRARTEKKREETKARTGRFLHRSRPRSPQFPLVLFSSSFSYFSFSPLSENLEQARFLSLLFSFPASKQTAAVKTAMGKKGK